MELLKWAVICGSVEVVKEQIKLYINDPKNKNINFDRFHDLMKIAAENDNVTVFKYFVKNGFSIPTCISRCLIVAVANNSTNIFEYLLKLDGIYLFTENNPNIFQSTYGILAVINGHLEIVKMIVEATGFASQNLIEEAIKWGRLEMIKYLISINQNVNFTDHMPRYIISSNNVEVIKFVVENLFGTEYETTRILFCAIQNCKIDIVKCLISVGCDHRLANVIKPTCDYYFDNSFTNFSELNFYLYTLLDQKDKLCRLENFVHGFNQKEILPTAESELYHQTATLRRFGFKHNFLKNILKPQSLHMQLIAIE
jgi:ankyrin repeat protein